MTTAKGRHQACDEHLCSLLAEGETPVARGLAHESHQGGASVFLLVTPDRLLWCNHGHDHRVASLDLSSVRTSSGGTQSHRYAMKLEHDTIERKMWVPAHRFLGFRWGTAEALVRRQETRLVFSRRDTKAAVAPRERLAHFGITQGRLKLGPKPKRLDPVFLRERRSG